ncbi:vitamin-D-receptor interacting mediator subunit 4-domain-containing protein [Lasiosphaeria hispida]|uniref:Mediator of RNA polymerase II transcription subunit 4 n=1 Tax=Lasiosphaeria hispida TaxID=260671 RepID=A0AAJ0HGK1_9PEZI|nr:vitamin-D-receptor interacting mediator subunit 4-domain-containing protein [Lasiosphaeria hispida]
MDKYLDVRFERVEKALANLIDSIAKYNPSEKLAEDLVAADKELAKGLKELERHQNNHARIQQLRDETAALDAQTKEIIGTLWTMRKEVKATQTTSYPSAAPKYQFDTADLLSYARRISRNTLPPPGVTNGVDAAPSPGPGPEPISPARAGTLTPSTSFNNNGQAATPSANGNTNEPPSQAAVSSSATELPVHLKPMVNLHDGALFFPWPGEDKIRSGALASYQALADRGVDPRGYDPEEEEARRVEEERAKKEAEEAARVEREEAERRMREERERMARDRERARQEAERRGSVAVGGARVTTAKSQFTFLDGLDDDDDDD